MVTLSAALFALACILSGYLLLLCITPPHAAGQNWRRDSIWLLYSTGVVRLAQLAVLGAATLHAAVALALDSSYLDVATQDLNLNLFAWNKLTTACFAACILVGAPLRLAAFRALGGRFTFGLQQPNELATSGIYAYVQHPSYTGLLLAVAPATALFLRWDASPAIWLPESVLQLCRGWGVAVHAVVLPGTLAVVALRIAEEEAMLKETFGKTWETWHAKTSRLVPGVF